MSSWGSNICLFARLSNWSNSFLVRLTRGLFTAIWVIYSRSVLAPLFSIGNSLVETCGRGRVSLVGRGVIEVGPIILEILSRISKGVFCGEDPVCGERRPLPFGPGEKGE